MAQAISHYTGIAKANIYVYPGTDGTQSGTQVAKGTTVVLVVDSSGDIVYENGLAKTSSPVSGWVNAGNLSDITAVYKTVPDRCSPPQTVTIDQQAKTLTVSGGAGGELNKFTGYRIRWRDAAIGSSAYGEWSESVAVTSSTTTVVFDAAVPDGYVRQYAARTTGSAGSDYYSAYVVADNVLVSNHAPDRPSIVLPADQADTKSQTPVFVLEVLADADEDLLLLKRRIDNGEWETVSELKSGTVYDKLPILKAGSHTVTYKLADPYSESDPVGLSFTVTPVVWGRIIETGIVISNKQISHRADIKELLDTVNHQGAWYGVKPIVLEGVIGRFGDWQSQMEQLQAAINMNRAAAGQSAVSITVPNYPTASAFNALREYAKDI